MVEIDLIERERERNKKMSFCYKRQEMNKTYVRLVAMYFVGSFK